MDTQAKNRSSLPPVFWGKDILINNNSIYPEDWKNKIYVFFNEESKNVPTV